MPRRGLGLVILAGMWSGLAAGSVAGQSPSPDVRVSIHPVRTVVPVGSPVWVDFLVANLGAAPAELIVPDTAPTTQPVVDENALPISHIFSGVDFSAIDLVDENADRLDFKVRQPVREAPQITLTPGGIIGRRYDLAETYRSLRLPGVYYVTWEPYGGAVESNRVRIEVAQLRQVLLNTNLGPITIRFHYEYAPIAIANFLELVREGFYDGKSFHRVVPGTLVQTGCPRGDGTGVRPDGQTIPAEFSNLPHQMGTVSMARKEDDPNSASCQFFICLMPIPEFDGRYTVFGEVVGEKSFETLRRFNDLKTDRYDRPFQRTVIESARVEPVPVGVAPLDSVSPTALSSAGG